MMTVKSHGSFYLGGLHTRHYNGQETEGEDQTAEVGEAISHYT